MVSILVNGAPSKPFKMERGIRQGDLLSPFLFVLMAEVLNKMLIKAVQSGLCKGIEVGCRNIYINHLQFAEDTLIFSRADITYLQNVKKVLLSFHAFSGLSVNYSKSGFIAMGKDDQWAYNVSQLLQCTLIQLPITYLGVPLGANMRKISSW